MESGTAVLPATSPASGFASITFAQPFAQAPVVVVSPSTDGSGPASVRIRNVTTTGFELVQVEPGGANGLHEAMTVWYLAVEPGQHELPDGTKIEAGTALISNVQHGSGVTGSESWGSLGFGSGFPSAPAVLAQIQSMDNEAGAPPTESSRPWLVVGCRNVGASSAQVALERCESAPGSVTEGETFGYIAVQAGRSGSFDADDGQPVTFQSFISADSIRGWDNGCKSFSLSAGFTQPPLVIASLNKHDSGEGGWLRVCSTSTSAVSFTVDEDQYRDSERSHTTEAAGVLVLSRPFGKTFGISSVPPDISLSSATYQVSEGAATANIAVALSHATTADVSVSYATSDGSATAGEDYQAVSDVLTIPSGQVLGTIPVPLLGDGVFEGDETFTITLSNPVGGALVAPTLAQVTIQEDEPSPTVAFESASFSVAEDGGSISLNVVLSSPCVFPVSVTFATADGSTTAGSDYTATSQVLSFPALSSSQPVGVTILDDGEAELDETVTLSLSAPSGAALGTPSVATLTILDNEPRPIAVITSPPNGLVYNAGDTLVMDGSSSAVPAGNQVWFAALDSGSGDPMLAVHSTSALSTSCMSGDADGYVIRLVIAAPGNMPSDAALRGVGLPCADTPVCDSTQVTVTKHVPLGPFYMTARGFSPAVVKLRWTDADPTHSNGWLYRGTSPSYLSYLARPAAGQEVYYDTSVQPGTTYYYRLEKYIGSTYTLSETVGATVPATTDTTLSLLPTVTTEWPDGFTTIHDSRAVVTVALQPEDPAEDLVGAVVELFMDEATTEEGSAFGESSYEPAAGRDDLGCVSRDPVATQSLIVSDPEQIVFQVPDVAHGQHAFRFRATRPDGTTRERGFIAQVNRPNGAYQALLYVGGGGPFKSRQPRLYGFGPASHHSPDCQDGDPRYYNYIMYRKDLGGLIVWNYYRAETDENGIWQFVPPEDLLLDDAPGGGQEIRLKMRLAPAITTGRLMPLADGGTWDLRQTRGSYHYPVPVDEYQTFTIPFQTGGGAATPHVDPASMPATISVADTSAVVPLRVRFRVLDEDQDLDLTSVRVTNLTLSGDPVVGFMSEDQVGANPPTDSFAFWAADVPMQAGPNQLRIEAEDLAGHTMSEATTVSREVPNVVARITLPVSGSSVRSQGLVPLDGASSQGPPDMEVRWVFYYVYTWGQTYRISLPELAQSTLVGQVMMPSYAVGGIWARLVVATPGNLPADLYSEDLPCSSIGGTPNCDSFEVRVDNPCCYSATHCDNVFDPSLTVAFASPAAGVTLPGDQSFVATTVTNASGYEPLYRWWIAPASDPGSRSLLTPLGTDGNGFAADAEEMTIDPLVLGLTFQSYILTVDAAQPASCIGNFATASRTIAFGHDLSGVAPGQTLAGGQVRVYGSTFVPGVPVTILLDDDPADPANERSFLLTPNDERYVVFDVPADMTPGLYFVAAADSPGAGESSWKQALEVLAPAYQVTNEEDPSCGGAGTECVHPIGFGQVVVGNWGEAGDVDYYYVTMGAGTTFDVTVSRVDTTLSPLHPDAVDPELFVVDPDGVVDGTIGYANDSTADDTNASIVGFEAAKDGLYVFAVRTLKGAGEYSVAVTKTASAAAGAFRALPYGTRSMNVIPSAGEDSTATFQAILIDHFGDPIAGASPDWAVVGGSVASSQVGISNASGVASVTITMGTDPSAVLEPGLEWPFASAGASEPPIEQAAVRTSAASGGSARRSTAILVYVEIDAMAGAVRRSELPAPDRIQILRSRAKSDSSVNWERERDTFDPQVHALGAPTCGGSVNATIVSLPAGAESIESLAIEFVDELGMPLTDSLTGITVRDLTTVQARLVAHCKDSGGTLFDAPIPDSPALFLQVASTKEEFAGGIRAGGSACKTAWLTADADLNPFTYEAGKRAIFTYVDEAGEPHFAATELLGAATAVKVKQAGAWEVVRGSTALDVQLEPGPPLSFYWLEPRNLVEAPLNVSLFDDTRDPWPDPVRYDFMIGPRFLLLDQELNVVPLWGQYDSQWHSNSATDDVYVADAGTWGQPPFTGIEFTSQDATVYNPVILTKVTKSATDIVFAQFDGTVTKDACFRLAGGGGSICDSFSVTNDAQDLALVRINGPWAMDYPLGANTPWNEGWFDLCNDSPENCGEYVTLADYLDSSSWVTSPGQPLVFARSGKPVLFRLDPVAAEESWFPNLNAPGSQRTGHDTILSDVPVDVWVTGPVPSPDSVGYKRSEPGEPFSLQRTNDVRLCTGTLVRGPENGDALVGSCAEVGGANPFQAQLSVSTEPKYFTTQAVEGELLGHAVGIATAPREPGYYNLVVESSDPRVCQAGQRCQWFGKSFAVLGGWFLDSDYIPLPEYAAIDDATTLYVRVFAEDEGPTLPVTIETIQGETAYHQLDLDLERISYSNESGLSQYQASFIAVPTTFDGDVGSLPLPVLYVPILEFRFEARKRELSGAGMARAMSTSQQKVAQATGRGNLTIRFPAVPYDPARVSPITNIAGSGYEVFASNCPDHNTGCAGIGLPTQPYAYQLVDDAGAGDPLRAVQVEIVVESKIGRLPGVDPTNVELVLEVIDPESEAWYDDEDDTENSGNDNLELLDDPDPHYTVAQVTLDSNGHFVSVHSELDRYAIVGPRFYRGGNPEEVQSPVPSWKFIVWLGAKDLHPIGARTCGTMFGLCPLSPHPGDNYQLRAYIKMRSTTDWQPAGKTNALSHPFTIWDRLFIEDDATYEYGMLLKNDLLAGQSSITTLAADFDQGDLSSALTEFGCNYLDTNGDCCESDPQQGACTRPAIRLMSAPETAGFQPFVRRVQCEGLADPDRRLHRCTASLVDASDVPFVAPLGLAVADGAGFGRGRELTMTGAAKLYIRDNLWRTFYDVQFASEGNQGQSTALPKSPAYWEASGLGLAWHLDHWRLYFDNNRPPAGAYGLIDSVIHLVTGADYRSPEAPWSVDAGGFSDHTKNTAVVHEPAFSSSVYAQVWAHEVFHQFNINHCNKDAEGRVLDHCTGTSTIKQGETPICLMSPAATSQGNYIGIGCATPLGSGHGRTVCVNQFEIGGPTVPNHIRYWNLLNVAP